MENKVTFSQLSVPLKLIVILSWIITSIFGLSFLIGFIYGSIAP